MLVISRCDVDPSRSTSISSVARLTSIVLEGVSMCRFDGVHDHPDDPMGRVEALGIAIGPSFAFPLIVSVRTVW